MTVCATFKVPNEKTFYHPDDLKNKVKVKLLTYNKRSCHYVPWVKVYILHLKWL